MKKEEMAQKFKAHLDWLNEKMETALGAGDSELAYAYKWEITGAAGFAVKLGIIEFEEQFAIRGAAMDAIHTYQAQQEPRREGDPLDEIC